MDDLASDKNLPEGSAMQLRVVFQASPTAIVQVDPQGLVRLWSPAAERLFGWRADEVLGAALPIVPEDRQAESLAVWAKALGGEPVTGLETERRHRSGRRIPVRLSTAAVYDDAGALLGAMALIEDLSDQRKTEARAAAGEAELRALFEAVQAGLLLIDADTHRIVDANAAVLKLLGRTRQEVIGQVCHAFVCPAVAGACPVTDLHQTVDDSERMVLTATGLKPVLKKVSRAEVGGHPFLIESLMDISRLKEVEDQVRRERDRAQRYLEVSGALIVVLGTDGVVQLINPAGARCLGRPESEIVGKHWFQTFLPAPAAGTVTQIFGELLANGAGQGTAFVENPVISADGRERTVRWHNAVLRDDAGNVTGTLSSGVDVTEQRAAEQALARLAEERLKLVEQLQESLSQVKKLSGLVPICSYCKQIRDDQGYWHQVEAYVADHSEAAFSHGLCPGCLEKHFPAGPDDPE